MQHQWFNSVCRQVSKRGSWYPPAALLRREMKPTCRVLQARMNDSYRTRLLTPTSRLHRHNTYKNTPSAHCLDAFAPSASTLFKSCSCSLYLCNLVLSVIISVGRCLEMHSYVLNWTRVTSRIRLTKTIRLWWEYRGESGVQTMFTKCITATVCGTAPFYKLRERNEE